MEQICFEAWVKHEDAGIFHGDDLEKSPGISVGVQDAVNGQDTSKIDLFRGTLFERVGNNTDFWLGIYLRIRLFLAACEIRSAGAGHSFGLVLFEQFPAVFADMQIDPSEIKSNIFKLFWANEWYEKYHPSYRANLIVERPAVRIDQQTFATTILNIGDSINCFIENSVMGYIGFEGVDVSASVFDNYISRPFEKQAIELFTNAGWQAGGVSTSCFWDGAGVSLCNIRNEPMPGEIDVLAISPDKTVALLVECKILSHPKTKSKLRNVYGKIGAKDDELFHAKIRKKIAWLRNTSVLQGMKIQGILLVDYGAFLAQGAEHPVLEIEELAKTLKHAQAMIS